MGNERRRIVFDVTGSPNGRAYRQQQDSKACAQLNQMPHNVCQQFRLQRINHSIVKRYRDVRNAITVTELGTSNLGFL
jgi:hypothetical protein